MEVGVTSRGNQVQHATGKQASYLFRLPLFSGVLLLKPSRCPDFLLALFKHRISSMQLIEQSDVSIIATELFVMEIVKVRLVVEKRNPWQSVATMVCLRPHDRTYGPDVSQKDVALE